MSNVFREKSIKRISTPEHLNACIAISGRFSWTILVAVVIFLSGVLLWSFTGRVETRVEFAAIVSNNVLSGYLKESEIGQFAQGASVYIESEDYTVLEIDAQPQRLPEDTEEYVMYIGALQPDSWVYAFKAVCTLPDGIYRATAVTETTRPIALIFE